MIKTSFSLNEFLNLKDETIFNKKGGIFKTIVIAYSFNQINKIKKESSDKKKAKQVKNNITLRAIKIVKL